ncbi:MAG: NAD(P)H-dependent oxidoreductase [Methanospirillum sp.]|nr:NAD(P)H-dependent oxidoreductase [Methanospirillum sp.]
MTKVVTISGSPRKDRNTSRMIRHIIHERENEGKPGHDEMAGDLV